MPGHAGGAAGGRAPGPAGRNEGWGEADRADAAGLAREMEKLLATPLGDGRRPPPPNLLALPDPGQFSMVHAAAGVPECPPALVRLVLKCLCEDGGDRSGDAAGAATRSSGSSGVRHVSVSSNSVQRWDLDPFGGWDLSDTDKVLGGPVDGADPPPGPCVACEETGRLPLHIAVCQEAPGEEGGARPEAWPSPLASPSLPLPPRHAYLRSSARSEASRSSARSKASTQGSRAGRPRRTSARLGRVFNARFGRSLSRDGVAAYSSAECRGDGEDGDGASPHGPPRTVVRGILRLHPASAARVDGRTGKLPVVLAVDHGRSWEEAVGPLLEAYPAPFAGDRDGPEATTHRAALRGALTRALAGPPGRSRDEAVRTAGRLAAWGGEFGLPRDLKLFCLLAKTKNLEYLAYDLNSHQLLNILSEYGTMCK